MIRLPRPVAVPSVSLPPVNRGDGLYVRPTAYGSPFWLGYLGNLMVTVAVSLLYRYADFVTFLGGTEYHLGWIVGVGMVGSLAMRLTLGVGIDHYGPRLMWLGSGLLFAGVCFAHLAVDSHQGLGIYLLRIAFCCAMAGIYGASITFVSGRAPAERVAELVGMLGTAGFVGTVIGTQLGDVMLGAAAVERWQIDRMFVVAGLLGIGSLPFVVLATRRLARPAPRRRVRVLGLLRRYNPGAVLLVCVAMGAGLSLPTTFLRTYTAELGIPRMWLFFGVYAAAALLTRIVTRRWTERFGPEPMILCSLGGLALSQLLFLAVRGEWGLIVPGIAYGMSHAVLFPSVFAAATREFPFEHRGLGGMLVLSVCDAGALVGAPLVGVILRYSEELGLPPYPTMFISMAGLLALTGVVYALKPGRAAAPQATIPEPHGSRKGGQAPSPQAVSPRHGAIEATEPVPFSATADPAQ